MTKATVGINAEFDFSDAVNEIFGLPKKPRSRYATTGSHRL